MRLHIVIPELVWPEPEDGLALQGLATPSLDWLLARGVSSRSPAQSLEAALASRFGFNGDAPFGALRLLGETADFAAWDPLASSWLCADPVHLRFHQERIILADAGAFELGADEAADIVAGLNREFGDLGRFHVADARRWYLQCREDSRFNAQPLSAVAGRKMVGDLGDDPQAARIRTWLNEIQMFLHGHPVNEARTGRGQPAVNSLWLWGGGSLPQKVKADYNAVWSQTPLPQGLAKAAGIAAHGLPEDLTQLIDQGAPGTIQLVVLDQLQAPVLYEDSSAWREALSRLECDWFAPLRAALGRRVGEATLTAPTVYGHLTWRISGADRWKLWRKSRPLAVLAKELAR